MPALQMSLTEPVGHPFAALLTERPAVAPTHPLGCRRPRVPDRVVCESVVAAPVHGSGCERIAPPGCSDRTVRRRVHAWAEAGLAVTLHTIVCRFTAPTSPLRGGDRASFMGAARLLDSVGPPAYVSGHMESRASRSRAVGRPQRRGGEGG